MAKQSSSISVDVKILGETLDPAILTEQLKINPTKYFRKGDVEISASGNQIHRKHGLWSFSTGRTAELGEALEIAAPVLAQVGANADWLKANKTIEKCRVLILYFVSSNIDNDTVEFQLTPQHVTLLQKARLPVSFAVGSSKVSIG
jgi:hypothetical protein